MNSNSIEYVAPGAIRPRQRAWRKMSREQLAVAEGELIRLLALAEAEFPEEGSDVIDDEGEQITRP